MADPGKQCPGRRCILLGVGGETVDPVPQAAPQHLGAELDEQPPEDGPGMVDPQPLGVGGALQVVEPGLDE